MKTYKIIEAKNVGALSQAVNEALSEGWQLEGGITITSSSQSIYTHASVLLQAVSMEAVPVEEAEEEVAEEKKAVKK